tara:strand:+ start:1438 stop:1665 length:228 start_codon:yes stop_codon:yes gene_type:complete
MSSNKLGYINPLGDYEDNKLRHNFVNPLKKSNITRLAQHEDSLKDIKSHQIQLTLWSLSTGLIVLAVLSMISKIK